MLTMTRNLGKKKTSLKGLRKKAEKDREEKDRKDKLRKEEMEERSQRSLSSSGKKKAEPEKKPEKKLKKGDQGDIDKEKKVSSQTAQQKTDEQTKTNEVAQDSMPDIRDQRGDPKAGSSDKKAAGKSLYPSPSPEADFSTASASRKEAPRQHAKEKTQDITPGKGL